MVVSALGCYPVKSLRGNAVTAFAFDELGPQHDRRWMLVDDSGQFITQRTQPTLCKVTAAVTVHGLQLRAEGFPSLSVGHEQVSAAGDRRRVRVWGDEVLALDAGAAAAAWFSDYLGVTARLCFVPVDAARQVDPDYAHAGDRVGFADGFPVLLISEASLRLASAAVGRPLEWIRFRPNIVVAGAEALAENDWRRLRIGEVEFEVAKPCSRCVIPSIDPDTAEKQSDVSQGLRRFRGNDGRIYFGQNLIHRGRGRVAVGDRVTVIS